MVWLYLRVNGDVESHEFPELGVGEAELVGEVARVVEAAVSGGDSSVIAVLVGIHNGCNARNLGAEIKAIFISGFPVLGLVDTRVVGLGEVGAGLASKNTSGELGHSVHVLGEGFDESLFLSSELTASVNLFLELLDFRLRRDFTSEQEPQNTLGDGLTTWDVSGGLLSDLVKVESSVGNTFLGIELGCFVKEAGETTHSSDNGTNGNLTNDSVGVLLSESNDFLLSLGNHVFHLLLENSGELASATHDTLGSLLSEDIHFCLKRLELIIDKA